MTKRERKYHQYHKFWNKAFNQLKSMKFEPRKYWYWTENGQIALDHPLPPVTITITKEMLNK